jgi:hypothetical protein
MLQISSGAPFGNSCPFVHLRMRKCAFSGINGFYSSNEIGKHCILHGFHAPLECSYDFRSSSPSCSCPQILLPKCEIVQSTFVLHFGHSNSTFVLEMLPCFVDADVSAASRPSPPCAYYITFFSAIPQMLTERSANIVHQYPPIPVDEELLDFTFAPKAEISMMDNFSSLPAVP